MKTRASFYVNPAHRAAAKTEFGTKAGCFFPEGISNRDPTLTLPQPVTGVGADGTVH